MVRTLLLIGLFLLTSLLGIAPPANAQGSPPATELARKIEALVTNAAALIEKQGKAAFSEFRKKDSKWFHDDTYLFVYDLSGNGLLNPAFRTREGTNSRKQRDVSAKFFNQAIIQMAETQGSGWVDYMFPKSGQTTPFTEIDLREKGYAGWRTGRIASSIYPQ